MLDSNEGGMDALRVSHYSSSPTIGRNSLRQFQFVRLMSYGTAISRKIKESRNAHARMFVQLEKQKLENRQLQSQIEKMVERTQAFDKMEAALQKHKRKQPEITHYLTAFAEMATSVCSIL